MVEIILNIRSTTFYSNEQYLALANMTVSDGVSPSLKGGGSRLAPPSKSATVYKVVSLYFTVVI